VPTYLVRLRHQWSRLTACACGADVEKTKQYSAASSPRLTIGQKSWRMRDEIRERHQAGQNERDRAREQAEEQHCAADELQLARDAAQRPHLDRRRGGTGKPRSFCVPCNMNKKAATMRRTLSSRGVHVSKIEFMRVPPSGRRCARNATFRGGRS
jgi:hypothetical protein